MSIDREQLVRAKAYEIWEREGRPHGSDERHWRQAEQEMARPVSKRVAKPAAARPGTKAARPGRKPAATIPKPA